MTTRPPHTDSLHSSSGRERRSSLLGPGFRLGKLAGVEIGVDVSLLLIFGLVLFNLAVGVLPQWHPSWTPALIWLVALTAALALFVSILLHELSHALVGRAVGVSISRITLFMFGGMAHMDHEPKRASSELWMAIAGPLTSFAIGIGATLVGSWLVEAPAEALAGDPAALLRNLGPGATVLLWLGPLNILLALFNLLPGFPLDGGRVLRALVWWKTGDLQRATRWATGAGLGLSWLMIGMGGLMALGFRVPVLGGGLTQGLWLVLIGWFLGGAARSSYAQLVTRMALERIAVRELMWTRPEVASPGESVKRLFRDRVLHADQQLFPVMQDGALLGAVTVDAIRELPEPVWETTPVAQVMTPPERLVSVSPDADASEALRLLGEQGAQELTVVDGHRLFGLVRRQDLLRWLSMHTQPGQRFAA